MKRSILVLAAVFALVDCGDGAPVGPIPRVTFIQVVAELRRAAMEASSEEDFQARKERILSDAGVTDSLLVEYVRVHGGRLEHMAEVWDSIDVRVQAVEDTLY
jgi:hypothetical protein